MANEQDNFADKVINSLIKQSKAVDLTAQDVKNEEPVVAQSDFIAYGAPTGGGQGPGAGGNKDIVIIPGYGGSAATSVSQINFYWNAPATPDSTGVDTNIRATIYNFATNPGSGVTRSVFAFGGYDGTNQYKPHPLYGGGTGITTKIIIDPFLGKIDTDYLGLNFSGVAATTDTGTLSYDTTQNRIRVGVGSGTAKTIAYTDDVSSTASIATTATNVNISDVGNVGTLYAVFTPASTTTAGVALSVDSTNVSYNAATNVLTAGQFSGLHTGTAFTATTGFFGNLTGTATTAQNAHVSAATTGTFYPVFTNSSTAAAGVALSVESTLSWDAATNTLTSGKFVGLASGTAATFTNFYGTLVGTATTAGLATTSQNVNIVTTNTGTFYPLFTSASTTASGVAVSIDGTDISYNAATNTLTAGTFSGNASGTAATFTNFFGTFVGSATTATNVNVVTAATGTFYPLFTNVTGTTSGAAVSIDGSDISYNFATNTLTAGTFSGNLSATAATATNFFGTLNGNVTGTATTSQNVNIVTTNTGVFYPLFTSVTTTASGVAISIDGSDISYNAATNVLTAGQFSGLVSGTSVTASTGFFGNLTGNVTGTATTSQNVNIVTTNTGTYYPLFTSASTTASGIAISIDGSDISYNAATNVLSAGQFSGLVTGAAITATTGFFGNLTGTATTSLNSAVVAAGSTVTPHFFMLANAASGSGLALSSGTGLTYNLATNTLYATNIVGTVQGTISGIASTASNVQAANAGSNAAHFLMFANPATSTGQAGLALSSNNSLQYNPSTNVLSLGSGSATINGLTLGATSNTITTSSGNLTLNSSGGTVIVAGNFNVQGTTTFIDSTTQTITDPVIVVGSGAGGTHSNVTDSQDRGIEFRRFSGSAITGFFGLSNSSGRFTFIPNANLSAANTYTGTVGVIEANLTGTAVTATNFFGTLVGNAASATTAGLATTAQNLNISATTTGTLYPLFTTASTTTSGVAVSVDGTDISYNAATNTLTAGQFSGLHTGTAFTATTGFFGNLTGTATTAQNINTVSAASGTFYPLLSSVSGGGSGVAVSVDSNLTYDAAIDTLTAGKFSGLAAGSAATFTNFYGTFNGSMTGTATTSQNVNVVTTNTGTFYPLFTSASTTASGVAISIDGTDISYNAATNVLTAGQFSGLVSGTSVTASTGFFGNLTGNVTGTATTSQNVNIVTTNTGTYYPLFTTASTTASGVAISIDGTDISYNAATNVLTAGQFSGLVTGAAITASTGFFGNLTGNVTGTATTSQNVNIVTTNTGTYYPLFTTASTTASGVAISIDGTDISYNAATNVLTAGQFSGLVSGTSVTASTGFFGNLTGNVTGTATTSQNVNIVTTNTGVFYPLFTSATTTASGVAISIDGSDISYNAATNVLTAGQFSGLHTGTAFTATTGFFGNLTGTATTAQNINVVTGATGTFYPLFTSASTTASGIAVSINSTNISYNFATNTLTAGTFSGNASGTAATFTNFFGTFVGSATTATNINAVAAGSAGAHYLLMSSSTSGSGIAVSTDASLSYVPSTDTLTVSNIFGSGNGVTISNSAALTNGTYLTIQTTSGDDNTTSDFFVRGVNSTGTSKFSVDANGNLRATTKSFDIDHPTKPGMRLVYGVLEGPEHGVYHRGTVEGKGELKVILPEYWSKLVCPDYTIQLSPWGNYGVHIVDKSTDYFIISINGNAITRAIKNIKVDYIVHGSRLDAPLEIEQ